jgi:hypothetical protein
MGRTHEGKRSIQKWGSMRSIMGKEDGGSWKQKKTIRQDNLLNTMISQVFSGIRLALSFQMTDPSWRGFLSSTDWHLKRIERMNP